MIYDLAIIAYHYHHWSVVFTFSSAEWFCSSDSFNLLFTKYQFTQEIPNKAQKALARTAHVKLHIAATILFSSFLLYLHKEL